MNSKNSTQDVIDEIDKSLNNSPEKKNILNSKLESIIINNSWNDKNEKLLASIGENAASYKWLHEKSNQFYSLLNTILNVLIILFSTGLSAGTFFPENSYDNDPLTILKRIFIYLVNVLTITINYLKLIELSNKHNMASDNFSSLYHDIQIQLCRYRKDRENATDYIQKILKRYDDLLVANPDIPIVIINKFKKTFNSENFAFPDIADKIHKIDIITDDEKDIKINTEINNFQKINNYCINGDITDEDLNGINIDELQKVKLNSLIHKAQWEEQRYFSNLK
jgi:hypothetical protein